MKKFIQFIVIATVVSCGYHLIYEETFIRHKITMGIVIGSYVYLVPFLDKVGKRILPSVFRKLNVNDAHTQEEKKEDNLS